MKILLEIGKCYKTKIDFDVYTHMPDQHYAIEKLNEYSFLILEKKSLNHNWYWFKILINGKIRYICQRDEMIAEIVKT